MYLTRLEMTGFKSFPDTVELQFLEGVTGIVGPNGSGKSNIADAIRWVLGEHNPRVLRGSKMEDVIFGGSHSRRALGAAEVTLVLDNSDRRAPVDCDEIRVSRRMYRSGETEYLINNSACRLKDVRDLFLDTGIGRNSYAIIEQGRIDAILSARSDERRAILDEAAGVAKYKARKQEALAKLEDAQRNLVRVWDLINELSVRVETTREQAEKAKVFLGLKDRLEKLETGLLGNRYVAAKEQLRALTVEADDLKQKHAFVLTKVSTHDARLVQLREQVSNMDSESERRTARLTEVVAAIERSEGRYAVAKERARLLEQESERSKKERADCEDRLHQLDSYLSEERRKLSSATARASELARELAAAESDMRAFLSEVASLEESIEQLKGAIVGVVSEMAERRNTLSDSRARLESSQRNAARLNERLEQARAARRTVAADASGVEQQLERASSERTAIQRKLEELVISRKDADRELAELLGACESKRRVIGRDESRLFALQDLERSHEGFYAGVRAVLEEFEGSPGVLGVVADLIKVAPEHVCAIESALGTGLQDIVVDSDRVAGQCIQFLKERGKGRATFLPLDLLRVPETAALEKRIASMPGAIGLASSLVRVTPQARPAVDYLLGRTVVASDLDAAVAIARALGGAARIVTLEGDIISQGGSMSGGSRSPRDQGILMRKTEMEQLRERIDRARVELGESERSVRELRQRISALGLGIEAQAEELKRIDLLTAELRSRLQSLRQDLSRLDSEERLILEECAELERAVESLSLQASEAATSIDGLAASEESLQAELAQRQASLKSRQADREGISERITALRVEVGKCEQEVKSQRAVVERVDLEMVSLRNRLSELNCLESERQRAAEDTDVEIEAALRDRDRFVEERSDLETQLRKLRQDRLETMASISECESAVKEARRELSAVEREVSVREVELARVSESMVSIAARLREEYMLDPDSLQTCDLGVDERSAARTVESLRRSIRDLGPVNTAAVEEFEETTKRYEFLCSQRDDLVNAEKALKSVISEIDEETKKRFSDAFEVVNTHFQEVFTNLFQGGRAHLALEDPDDLLSSGVEVYAEPPGKKLQSLSLLSGGERALTAIALIFALMKVNPSPFAVLDEIDAPLDDSNVDRFARLLRELAATTQFVVVTHRKGTMQAADALYGVTMEESGVSKVVSVRLQE